MKKLKVLIVDDEALARDELKHILKSVENVKVVGEAQNGIEALNAIKSLNPDVLFLDIEMPGLSGMDVARKILDSEKNINIIFATAYDAYAVAAFEVNAVDYILKPFDSTRIKKSIRKIEKELAKETHSLDNIQKMLSHIDEKKKDTLRKIPVKIKGSIKLLDVDEIVYAKIEGGIVFLCESEKEFMSDYTSLEKLQQELNPDKFFRSHRNFLVNLELMKEVTPLGSGHYMIKCATKKGAYLEIPLSRRQAKILKEKIKF